MKLRFILSLIIFITGKVFSAEVIAENEIFDQYKTTSHKLLLEEYGKSRILFLGTANHFNHHIYNLLTDLLKEIGKDPKLKYIVFERSSDISQFYEKLSEKTLGDVLTEFHFVNEEAKTRSLCESPEWAYTISDFFPEIRTINRNRVNKVLVKSVDGMRSDLPLNWPGRQPIIDGTCRAQGTPTAYVVSTNREMDTAKNFSKNIWQMLGPNEKAIVVYHQAHLLEEIETCMPFMLQTNKWVAIKAYFSWISYFLNEHPEAKSQIRRIFLDEKSQSAYEGMLKFTKRQADRYPYQEFAISLTHFTRILKENGFEMYLPESSMGYRTSLSDRTLPEVAEGLIWNPSAHIDTQIKSSHDYLPEHCL